MPSRTTLAGLLRHLTTVERNWSQQVLAGPAVPEEDVEGGWAPGDETVAELIDEYARECARSRQVAAGMGLDDAGLHPHLGQVSLRWVLVHMIDETARHAGHADILRELTDGSTGAV